MAEAFPAKRPPSRHRAVRMASAGEGAQLIQGEHGDDVGKRPASRRAGGISSVTGKRFSSVLSPSASAVNTAHRASCRVEICFMRRPLIPTPRRRPMCRR